MRTPLTFFVAGAPAGQPRIKASSRGGFVRCYTPLTVKNAKTGKREEHPAQTWKHAVISAAQEAFRSSGNSALWEGPLCVNITFYFERPKNHFRSNGEVKPSSPRWHQQKPDRDNCDKLVLDSLTYHEETKFGLWTDDKQVCDGRIRKLYSNRMGCEIEIKEAGEP